MTDKPKRSDAGVPRLMPRDAEAFVWLEEMRCMWEDDLSYLLARIAGRDEPLSLSATQATVRRWLKLGLVERQRVIYGRPPIVALTERGALMAGGVEDNWRVPSLTMAPHTADVARFRLWAERVDYFGAVREYISERHWRLRFTVPGAKDNPHAPDALVTLDDGTRVAVEVERSIKAPERAIKIAGQLLATYDRVLYVVTSDAAKAAQSALQGALTRTPSVDPRRVRLVNMPTGILAPRDEVKPYSLASAGS